MKSTQVELHIISSQTTRLLLLKMVIGSLVNEQQLQCDYGQLIDALAQSEKYLEDSLHQNSRVISSTNI